MNTTKTDTLKVPGASLYYEVTGSGPLLLMIPGAPADAGGFAALVQQLADRYTVVSYDWRGASRSPLDRPSNDQDGLPMQVQGDDADRLLAAIGAGPAYVLGCSGGALTALDLVARHPERVATLVAHEPPAMNLLPDGADWRAAFQAVAETYRRNGAGPAMLQFIETAMRTGGPEAAEDGQGATSQQAPPPEMPDMSQLPPEMLEGMARMQANSEFFLAHLLATTIEHIPDVAALQVATPRIVVGVGEVSQGQMPHRAALALAERLAASPVSFPGDHQGFATHPGPFAETVHKALLGS